MIRCLALTLIAVVGCRHEAEGQRAVAIVDFEGQTFNSSPQVLNSRQFSITEINNTFDTKYFQFMVESNGRHITTMNEQRIPGSFGDVLFFSGTTKYLCLRRDAESNLEGFWYGNDRKLERAQFDFLKKGELIAFLPTVSCFVLYQFGRPPDEHKIVLYRVKPELSADSYIESVELDLYSSPGDWLLTPQVFVDEAKNLVGLISSDGYPRIWSVSASSVTLVPEFSLQFPQLKDRNFGTGKATVAMEDSRAAVLLEKVGDKAGCRLFVWSLESGELVHDIDGLECSSVTGLYYRDQNQLLVFEERGIVRLNLSSRELTALVNTQKTTEGHVKITRLNENCYLKSNLVDSVNWKLSIEIVDRE